jgi:integrating conjugative element protein (TIGR03761 family)
MTTRAVVPIQVGVGNKATSANLQRRAWDASVWVETEVRPSRSHYFEACRRASDGLVAVIKGFTPSPRAVFYPANTLPRVTEETRSTNEVHDSTQPLHWGAGCRNTLQIHTQNAYWLLMGQQGETSSETAGGAAAASALRKLWMLTATDNPYADWALVLQDRAFNELNEVLWVGEADALGQLRKLRDRGLGMEIMTSNAPATLNLTVQSPYGFSIALQTANFDRFVRIVRALSRQQIRSMDEASREIRTVARALHDSYLVALKFQRLLMSDALANLSRADFLASADPAATQRAELARALLGEVPVEIMSGDLSPGYSRRPQRLEVAQKQVLHADRFQDIEIHIEQVNDLA